MRPTQKMALIDAVARELQRRYSFQDIDTYLHEFDVKTDLSGSWSSKWLYVKAKLGGAHRRTLERIAEDLEIKSAGTGKTFPRPPRNWPDGSKFRLFIRTYLKIA